MSNILLSVLGLVWVVGIVSGLTNNSSTNKIISPNIETVGTAPSTSAPTPYKSVFAVSPSPSVYTVLLSPTPVLETATSDTELSNDNYYTNSRGNEVHSPAYSNSVPAGATAICGDGTYSFSQSRRGTCSHHGGVDQWL